MRATCCVFEKKRIRGVACGACCRDTECSPGCVALPRLFTLSVSQFLPAIKMSMVVKVNPMWVTALRLKKINIRKTMARSQSVSGPVLVQQPEVGQMCGGAGTDLSGGEDPHEGSL